MELRYREREVTGLTGCGVVDDHLLVAAVHVAARDGAGLQVRPVHLAQLLVSGALL